MPSARFRSPGTVIPAAIAVLAVVLAPDAVAAKRDGLWTELTAAEGLTAAESAGETRVAPARGELRRFRLNRPLLDRLLARAKGGKKAARKPVILSVPTPEGAFNEFVVAESAVMDPELSRKYPAIRTYRAQGRSDRAETARLARTPLGFQATVVTPKGVFFVEPERLGEGAVYVSYRVEGPLAEAFKCTLEAFGAGLAGETSALTPSGSDLRTYRLAVAATGEYTSFFGGGVNALAAIATTVNSVDAIYNAEIAVQLTLVANNDLIIYPDATSDPFPLANKNAETQLAIDAAIGNANYDIGHLFHRAGSSISGNAGCIGCVCTAGQKGSGWSQGPTPGDGNFVFLVSHEMGHQHGANHTWNGPGCGSEVSPARYEPGSGTTIMSYSSICGADNIQGSQVGDLYFHAGSRMQITSYTSAGGACGAVTPLANILPSVSAGADYTIPRGTPFVLTASAADPDGDALTYSWEQFDIGDNAALSAVDNGNIPLFRSFPPAAEASRMLPVFADLLAGTASLFPNQLGEQLPSTDRSLTFRATVRDNKTGGGGADADQMTITVLGAPFEITSPSAGGRLECGVNDLVEWNVGGGSVAPTVTIRLSGDGGASFPAVLAAATPNDGQEGVPIPALLSPDARLKVEAEGNIFFALSEPTAIEDTLAPSAACPAAVVIECTGNNGVSAGDPQLAAFFAGASGSDACDASVDLANDAPAFFMVGTTPVTFTATDASGNAGSCTTSVTVADTQPPTIAAGVSPRQLWPPNHQLVEILASVAVSDVCNPSPTFALTSITSNEPDNGNGDGNTNGDVQGADFGTPDVGFQLRAERQGGGSGRIYTILYTAADGSGNTAQAQDAVLVPHSRKK